MGRKKRTIPPGLGQKLQQIRAALGLTQAQMFAALQRRAASDQTAAPRRGDISEFESNRRDPGLLILHRYVQVVNERFGNGLILLEHLVNDQTELPPLAQSVGLRREATAYTDAEPLKPTADRKSQQRSSDTDCDFSGSAENVFGKVFAQGANFCLFQKMLDKDAIYLELTGLEFDARLNGVAVKIPLFVWEQICRVCVVQLDLAEASDRELRRLADREVDLRLLAYHRIRQLAPSSPPAPVAPVAAWAMEDDQVYGSASDERAAVNRARRRIFARQTAASAAIARCDDRTSESAHRLRARTRRRCRRNNFGLRAWSLTIARHSTFRQDIYS